MLGAHIKIKSGREFFVSALASSECVCVYICGNVNVCIVCYVYNIYICRGIGRRGSGRIRISAPQTIMEHEKGLVEATSCVSH